MTADQARSVLKLVLANFATQRQRMTRDDLDALTMVWEDGLADIEFEAGRLAAIRIVRTARFLPTIAELRAAVVRTNHGAKRTGIEAWGVVLRAMRIEGSHKAPGVDFYFPDPIIDRVVRAMGWRDLCAGANQVADRAHFIQAYDRIAGEEFTEALASDGAENHRLPGRTNQMLSFAEIAKRLQDSDEGRPQSED